MRRIELGLHAVHAAAADAAASAPPRPESPSPDVDTPFAKLNSVAPHSPADTAGLQRGDYIKRFGRVHALNHDKLRRLGEEVKANENVRPPPFLCIRIGNPGF